MFDPGKPLGPQLEAMCKDLKRIKALETELQAKIMAGERELQARQKQLDDDKYRLDGKKLDRVNECRSIREVCRVMGLDPMSYFAPDDENA